MRFACGTFFALGMLSALGQEKATSSNSRLAVVSFVGCKSDGQVGPVEAPEGTRTSVLIGEGEAQQLAYYRSAQGIGVLAPRGRYCFGSYGSGGHSLYVAPQPIGDIFSKDWNRFSGSAISLSRSYGGTSGRFQVAEVIARVFPARKAFVAGVMEMFDVPPGAFPNGPYPTDILAYKSSTMVEYTTPPQTTGLGTYSLLKKNTSPISGVAILVGKTPDLLLLSVRLPSDLARLASAIVRQVESGAELP